MHEPQDVTLTEQGEEVHPAFGSISAGRVMSGEGAALFDSDVRHRQFVRVSIGTMTRKRDLKRDWLFERKNTVEVDMSEAQWAAFVSSMNTSAVPCTLRRTENDRDVPGLHYAPRMQESLNEARGAAAEAFGKIQEAMAEYDALDVKAGAKERRAALALLRSRIAGAEANVEFASKSLEEHAENVVAKSRADIEAMVVGKARQLGLTDGQAAEMTALESGVDAPRALPVDGTDGLGTTAARLP